MRKSKYKEIYAAVIIVFILLFSFSPPMQSYLTLPGKCRISVGDTLNVPLVFPDRLVKNLWVKLLDEHGLVDKYSYDLVEKKEFLISGKYKAQLTLWGLIPIKHIDVDVFPQIKVYPAGHSIGVVLKAQGVMVIGYSAVNGGPGIELYPAKEQGIQIGDIIYSVNQRPVGSDYELASLIAELAKTEKHLTLGIIRNGLKMDFTVKPVECQETNTYRIGLYVRDTAAGVGTLTFYDGQTSQYGALGHVIANADLSSQLNDGMGKIVSASIQGINHGKKGFPGEKIGSFTSNSLLSGIILKNCQYGIYGVLDKLPINKYYDKPIPVAYTNQIKTGPANILTVLEGEKIEEFEILVEKIIPYQKQSGKGLVIRITDPILLAKTGGIIQGMSGSPIIQDGKLIGAVTHVFVQDPTRGYGIPAEWMLQELNMFPKDVMDSMLSRAS
ncbi:MAG: SpoIVB peptidase [Bacillota bacterium]